MWIKKVIGKYPVVAYLVFTFMMTWLVWAPIYMSSKGMISSDFYTSRMMIYDNSLSTFIFIGGSMPSIIAIVFTGILNGRQGIKELLSKFFIWKVNPFWYIFILMFNFFVIYLPYLICNLFGDSFLLYFNTTQFIPIYFLIAIIFWGPLGEEIGWRGYVLPRLQSKFHPLLSGIILGILWGLWHLPLFFISSSSQYGSSFIAFLVSDIALSIVFTWVYNHTRGSLLISSLFHAAWNFTGSVIILSQASANTTGYTIIGNALYVISLVFIIRNIAVSKKAVTEAALTEQKCEASPHPQ